MEYGIDYSEITGSPNEIVSNEIISFSDESLETGLYDLVRCEQLKVSFTKILSFLNDKKAQRTAQPQKLENPQTNSLNWQGTPLMFTEPTKALIQSNLISPELSEKERFEKLKQFFNIVEFDEGDKLKDIRKRTNTTTPLLNILETSLNNWIKNKD